MQCTSAMHTSACYIDKPTSSIVHVAAASMCCCKQQLACCTQYRQLPTGAGAALQTSPTLQHAHAPKDIRQPCACKPPMSSNSTCACDQDYTTLLRALPPLLRASQKHPRTNSPMQQRCPCQNSHCQQQPEQRPGQMLLHRCSQPRQVPETQPGPCRKTQQMRWQLQQSWQLPWGLWTTQAGGDHRDRDCQYETPRGVGSTTGAGNSEITAMQAM